MSALDIDPARPPALAELKASSPVRFGGRVLACDVVTPHTMVCTLAADGTLSATFRGRRRDFPLEQCDFIAADYFVSGVSLRLIDPDLDPYWVEQARRGTLCLKELRRDAGAPELTVDPGYRGPQVQPELHLLDERGLFARLKHPEFEADLVESGYRRKGLEFTCPLDRVAETLQFLIELGWKVLDKQGRRVLLHSGQQIEVVDAGNALCVRGEFCFGGHRLPLSSVRRGALLQPLDGVSVALLPKTVQWGGGESIPRHLVGALQPLLDEPGVTASGPLFERPELSETTAFEGLLRPYQREGVAWLQNLFRRQFSGLLADDMGLGKTVQVLAFLSSLSSDSLHLIVAPASLLFNWQREAERFVPSLGVHLYHRAERSLRAVSRGLLLTSYETLRRDAELFKQCSFSVIVLDEAQAIKNPDSQAARAVCSLSSAMRLSVTGTPVENRGAELWSQFRFLEPDLLGPRSTFAPSPEISQRIRPFFLRRTKLEVAPELPERLEQTVLVEPSSEERALYDSLLTRPKETRLQQLELLLRLRQACCHPRLVSSAAQSTKLLLLMEDLATVLAEGRQVLIFSSFTTMLDLIGSAIKERGWRSLRMDGSTRDRESLVQQFQSGSSQILLLSLKVGGVGLNLTAAEYVFLYEPWWNGAAEAQAIDRAHRIGQTRAVVAKRFIVRDSVEERMMLLKEKKRLLGDFLLDGSALSGEDLLALFGK